MWHFCGATNTSKLERLQYPALKFVYREFNTPYETLLEKAGLPTLELSRKRSILIEVFKALNKLSPPFMHNLFNFKTSVYNLRSRNQLQRDHSRTVSYGLHSLSKTGAQMWNRLPNHFTDCTDLNDFKRLISTWTDKDKDKDSV